MLGVPSLMTPNQLFECGRVMTLRAIQRERYAAYGKR